MMLQCGIIVGIQISTSVSKAMISLVHDTNILLCEWRWLQYHPWCKGHHNIMSKTIFIPFGSIYH